MREAPGVNGVTSQFEDLLSEVPHQCSQLDAIIVIVYHFLPGRASHTYSATSNEGRTPRALDDAH